MCRSAARRPAVEPHPVDGHHPDHVAAGDKIVVHREQLGERITGLVAAYLLWMGLVPNGPQAISITELLFDRELGKFAR